MLILALVSLVLLMVECKGLPPRSADSRTWCLEDELARKSAVRRAHSHGF